MIKIRRHLLWVLTLIALVFTFVVKMIFRHGRKKKGHGNGGDDDHDEHGEETPVIDFRFGDKWRVTSFVQKTNPQVKQIAKQCIAEAGDDLNKRIEWIARYIGFGFNYPLNSYGQPASEALLRRFRYSPNKWIWFIERPYTWLFPVETDVVGWGICIDTANLFASIARACDIPCHVCLGSVWRTSDNQMLGYHAWCGFKYRDVDYIAETTIHGTAHSLLPADDIYNRKMEVYYVLDAFYDEKKYVEKEKILSALEKHRVYYESLVKEERKAKGKRKHPAVGNIKIKWIRQAVEDYWSGRKP